MATHDSDGGVHDDVWRSVKLLHPDLPVASLETYRATVDGLRAEGLAPARIAAHIGQRISDARRVMTSGLAVFDRLVATVELCGRALEGALAPADAMRHLVETKLASAKLMLELAQLGLWAGAPTATTVDDARRYLAESEADHARFAASLARRPAPAPTR